MLVYSRARVCANVYYFDYVLFTFVRCSAVSRRRNVPSTVSILCRLCVCHSIYTVGIKPKINIDRERRSDRLRRFSFVLVERRQIVANTKPNKKMPKLRNQQHSPQTIQICSCYPTRKKWKEKSNTEMVREKVFRWRVERWMCRWKSEMSEEKSIFPVFSVRCLNSFRQILAMPQNTSTCLLLLCQDFLPILSWKRKHWISFKLK